MICNTLGQFETKLYNNDYCYLLRINCVYILVGGNCNDN